MPHKPGSLSKIRTLARKLAREEEIEQTHRRAARTLARKGRGGDTEIAHVTPGEIVIPRVLQTPEVMAALEWAAAGAGLTLNRMRVGAKANSINPATGAPEFRVDDNYTLWHDQPPTRMPPIDVIGRRIDQPPRRIVQPLTPFTPFQLGPASGRGEIGNQSGTNADVQPDQSSPEDKGKAQVEGKLNSMSKSELEKLKAALDSFQEGTGLATAVTIAGLSLVMGPGAIALLTIGGAYANYKLWELSRDIDRRLAGS